LQAQASAATAAAAAARARAMGPPAARRASLLVRNIPLEYEPMQLRKVFEVRSPAVC